MCIRDSYTEGTTGHFVNWDLYDDNPLLYILYVDEIVNATGSWDGSDISVNVDGHLAGTYNYTLYLVDSSANYAASTVFVNVLSATTSSTTDTTSTTTNTTSSTTSETGGDTLQIITLSIALGSGVIIIIVVIFTMKSKS